MTNIPQDTLILSAEAISLAMLDVPQEPSLLLGFTSLNETNSTAKLESKPVVNAFTVGLSYIAGDAETSIAPDALANIPVGIQEHAIAVGSMRIFGHPDQLDPTKGNSQNDSEAYTIAKSIQKKSAKQIAYDAAKKRVSRRLLLAERAKKITVTCPVTGIVSQMEIPSIPYKTLVWTSPLADLANCRGIAQQGFKYLNNLDTQTLAGVLIVLAGAYDLFRYQPFDSGAQKNAIIRTVGKHRIIQAIILIEDLVHSGNCRFLPRLSLVFDTILEREGAEIRFHNYLNQLADAIAEPDKEAWDENRALPQYPIRPVYTKDVEKKQKTVSFLAKGELAQAKKQFALDKKEGKALVLQLAQTAVVPEALKILLRGIFADDSLLSISGMVMAKLVERLTSPPFTDNEAARKLAMIFMHDRRALQFNLDELDDPAPGQESAIEDTSEGVNLLDTEMTDIADPTECHIGIDGENMGNDLPEQELVPPEGLSTINKILWKKKMQAAMNKDKPRKIVQTDLPSTAVYIPTAKKQNLGE